MPCSGGPKLSSLLFLLSLLLILHSSPANSDYLLNYQWNNCPTTDANYTTNSTFQANLNLLLSSLCSAAFPTGFANDTKGQPPDQVYGLALCRGDTSPAECRSCLNTSTQEIIKRCPNGMSSAIWYEGCLLRYSDQSFFSTADTSFHYQLVGGLASDPQRFKKLLGQMMDNLTTTAANVSTEMFATGVAEFTNSSTLYGLVQCTRDLPHDECYRCLKDFVGIIPECCNGRAIAWPPPTDAPVSPSPESEAKGSPTTNAASGAPLDMLQNLLIDGVASWVLPLGNLANLYFVSTDPIRREQLEWGVRCRIIKRIGRGLLYLHEDSRLRIVHRDLKASNILLDGDMNPKISDFGLAKLFGMDETHESTRQIAGTFGYMAPEYVRHGHFSTKSDVFSYGVLVLEIATGQRNSGFEGSGHAIDLPSYVWEQWNQGLASQVIDQSLVDRCELQEVLRCIHIGLLCVQADPAKRPGMAAVVLMLDGSSVPLPSPSVPAFYVRSGTISKSDALKEVTNECSLDEVDGER
ncbi:putative cysteine-rich receptor-like protein kinase 6 [Cocos nucifera]|nr:putative cysteine-rich receptor-like protein kinase 6 [Cocos nucifera]